MVKSWIRPFVCSENRRLPRLKCRSETKNVKFGMNMLCYPIPLYSLLRNNNYVGVTGERHLVYYEYYSEVCISAVCILTQAKSFMLIQHEITHLFG